MVKDHSDSERGNPLPPHGLLFPISSKGSFICIIPDRMTHTTAFVTPVVDHWLEREIAQWVHPMKDRPDDPSHHERTLLPRATSRSQLWQIHGLIFPISSDTYFVLVIPQILHHILLTTSVVTTAVEMWLEWLIATMIEGSTRRPFKRFAWISDSVTLISIWPFNFYNLFIIIIIIIMMYVDRQADMDRLT